jgi:hypothetical protein
VAVLSSRRSVVSSLALAALSGIGIGFWGTQSHGPATSARPPPTLPMGFRRGAFGPVRDQSESDASIELRVALWLTFASISAVRQEEVLDAIEEAITSLDARLNPFAIDLSGYSPEQVLRRVVPWLLPPWTAARSLARSWFASGDGALTVVLPTKGVPLPEAFRSLDGWDRTDSSLDAQQARFLAWATCFAERRRFLNASLCSEARGKLRILAGDVKSTIALVVDRQVQSVSATSGFSSATQTRLAALQQDCRRALPHTKRFEAIGPLCSAIASGLPPAPILPWLELEDHELLVVPRLGALARLDEFSREIEAVGAGTVH